MSYWGAQVIINLFGAFEPLLKTAGIDFAITEWIRGDYLVSDATINRFFALHVIALPLVILLLVVLALWNPPGLFAAMVVFAVVANVPCLIIQRYNRARIARILARREGRVVLAHAA